MGTWGNRIGSQCVRLKEEQMPEYDPVCGDICVNNKGEELATFCPPGYRPDCKNGCELQEDDSGSENEDPEQLLKNVELVIMLLARTLDSHMTEAFHTPM